MGTTSAISPRSGTVRSRSAPARAGMFPPAAASWRMLIVPPVNTTTTRGTSGRSARGRSIGAAPMIAAGVVGRIEIRVDLQVDRPRLLVGRGRLPITHPPTRCLCRCRRSRRRVAGDLRQAAAPGVEEILRARDLRAERLDEWVGPVADACPRVTLDRAERTAQIDGGDPRRADER